MGLLQLARFAMPFYALSLTRPAKVSAPVSEAELPVAQIGYRTTQGHCHILEYPDCVKGR